MDRPLRLITANPVDQLARTVEALLVVASAPLSVEELAQATTSRASIVRASWSTGFAVIRRSGRSIRYLFLRRDGKP